MSSIVCYADWRSSGAVAQSGSAPRSHRGGQGSNPLSSTLVISRDRNDPEPTSGFGVLGRRGRGGSGRGSWRAAGGLVVAGGIEGEVAEEFVGGGVDDPDVQVLDQEQDVGSGAGSADADVVELAAVAQGDRAVGIEPVGADAVAGVVWSRLPGVALGRAWVGSGGDGPGGAGTGAAAGGYRCWRTRRGELGRWARLALWGTWAASQFLRVCWNRSGLALGLRVVWLAVLLGDAPAPRFVLRSRCGRPCRRTAGW